MAVVPAREMAGLMSTMGPAYTALGRLFASLWGLSAGLLVSFLPAQGCEMIVATAGVALLTLGRAFGVRMGVSTLLTVIMG